MKMDLLIYYIMKIIKSLAKMTPLMKRITLGKTLGFLIGAISWLYLVYFTSLDTTFAFGVLLWCTITGVLIGAMGVLNKHPLFDFKI
jgi:uncharacterized membrane protein